MSHVPALQPPRSPSCFAACVPRAHSALRTESVSSTPSEPPLCQVLSPWRVPGTCPKRFLSGHTHSAGRPVCARACMPPSPPSDILYPNICTGPVRRPDAQRGGHEARPTELQERGSWR